MPNTNPCKSAKQCAQFAKASALTTLEQISTCFGVDSSAARMILSMSQNQALKAWK